LSFLAISRFSRFHTASSITAALLAGQQMNKPVGEGGWRSPHGVGKAAICPFGCIRFHRIDVVAFQAYQLRPASSVGHGHQPLLASGTAAYIHW
jgi:hypothetical protein